MPERKVIDTFSIMESDRLDPAQARRIAERAEAAPWIDYPPTPRWFAPATGLWSGALVLMAAALRDERPFAALGLLLLVLLEGAFLGWYSRYQGVACSA